MSLTRFVLPGLMLGLVLSLTPSVAKATPVVSGVVLGNLGSSGTDLTDISDTNNVINPSGSTTNSIVQLAQGFNTGASGFGAGNSLLLSSVNAVFGNNAASPLSVTAKLYSNNGSNNPGTLLTTSVAQSVPGSSGASLYTFDFSQYSLTASTSYWVVFDQAVSWFTVQDTNGNGVNPTIQNALSPATNNFSYVGARRKNGLGNWAPSGSNFAAATSSAFSVNVVPEPSTYAMAGIGAGLVGLARIRRRMR